MKLILLQQKISTLDGIETAVTEDVENTISELEKEFDLLKSKIDTYDKYKKDSASVEDFYNKILKTNNDACIRLYEYASDYATIIMNSINKNIKIQRKYTNAFMMMQEKISITEYTTAS